MVGINICDIVIILTLLLFMASGLHKGLVRSVFGLFKSIVAIILAAQAFPYITRILRQTGGVYDMIAGTIRPWLSQNAGAAVNNTLKSQVDLINGLALPQFLKDSLISGNNSVLYEAMNVESIYDYITEYLTNICINIIGWIIAFIVITLILSVLAGALDLLARLPVINAFNKLGGLIVGFLEATIFIWIAHVIVILFFSSPQYARLGDMIGKSLLAGSFIEYNVILGIINKFVI